MKSCNLIPCYQGALVLESIDLPVDKKYKLLKPHEIRTLRSFCEELKTQRCTFSDLEGYFVGYTINQIGKEFDLLRFGKEYLLNIELKSELKTANKHDKILQQLQKNYYYLIFLNCPLKIFAYVENDGCYEYNPLTNEIASVPISHVSNYIKNDRAVPNVDPSTLFVPSNYLISPFNSTQNFMSSNYFLTTAQQKIKDEILQALQLPHSVFICISANAGTGKTLLMYDIAKELHSNKKNPLIIHCGKLNAGQTTLNDSYFWNIQSIRAIQESSIASLLNGCDIIFIDESQRIRIPQLSLLMESCVQLNIPIVFSNDTKQYLREGETLNIPEFCQNSYPAIPFFPKRLTTKIRTNKQLSSFIQNLLAIGSSNSNLDYKDVSIEYINDYRDLANYIHALQEDNWMPITYTTSQYCYDTYRDLSYISEYKAHDVIGQEFSKVVFVMDENFEYTAANRLSAKGSYYSANGMLYQIVTRVIDELKIIVYNNPTLYLKLLEIKSLGDANP